MPPVVAGPAVVASDGAGAAAEHGHRDAAPAEVHEQLTPGQPVPVGRAGRAEDGLHPDMLSTRDVIRVDLMSTYVEENFTRDTDYIADRITADGGGDWPVAPGR